MQLILASSSPARLAVLRGAGIDPLIFEPEVDEALEVEKYERELGRKLDTAEMVQFLGRLKAEDVAARHGKNIDGLILGGDSAFLLEGKTLGKPHFEDVALKRAKEHRGKTGTLHSGHWLINHTGHANRGGIGEVDTARVHLSQDVTDLELEKYVATKEPLKLAGGFAIDGLSGAFIDRIEGAPSCVIGLSLPSLRRLVTGLGFFYPDLWNRS